VLFLNPSSIVVRLLGFTELSAGMLDDVCEVVPVRQLALVLVVDLVVLPLTFPGPSSL
jgi:hypothetical protein